MSLMGVDVGTTGVKAVVFNEAGGILASAYQEYPLLFPFPGAAELDSQRILDASFHVIAQAAGQVKQSDPVQAIGIASQGEAFVPLTAQGEVLGNMMTSSDARARQQVAQWNESFGAQRLYRITGHTPYPMYSLFKLDWLRQERPDIWRKANLFLFAQDLLAHALTGEACTDEAMAARSMLFDVRARQWSDEILSALELSPDRLPRVVRSGEAMGAVLADKAATLGLEPGVPVAVCGHDQPVGALGCGAVTPGCASYSIGTVECICPVLSEARLCTELMKANLACYPHVLPDLYTTVAFNITGGSVLKWVRDTLAREETAEALRLGEDSYARIIATVSDTPARVIMLPHFGPTGTPNFDATGVGLFFGLQLSTTRAELFRAVLEGITYEMKWNLAILAEAGFQVSELRAVGGGSRSARWMQIKADILGLPLRTMRVTEGTCAGAALLAGAGIQLWGAADRAQAWANPIQTFEPDPRHTALYEERFAIYRELYASLTHARQLHQQLSGATS